MIVVVLVVCVVVAAAAYLTWLAGRHDRLTARAEAGWAALDAQLVRRAAAGRELARLRGESDVARAAGQALDSALATSPTAREQAENTLSRALRAGTMAADEYGLSPQQRSLLADLRVAESRVALARQFHNDAVRDLRALRDRPAARLLRLRRGAVPAYFEIDDTALIDTALIDTALVVAPGQPAAPMSPDVPPRRGRSRQPGGQARLP